MYDQSGNRNCMFGCLCTVCTGLIIAGIVVLSTSSNVERDELVKQYDSYALEWEQSVRRSFMNASFLLSVDNETYYQVSRDESDDLLKDEGTDLLDYHALKYTKKGPLTPTGEWNTTQRVVVFNATKGIFNRSRFSIGPAPFMYEDRVYCNQKVCNHQYGGRYEHSGSYCVVYYVLTSICVKVHSVGGVWLPDSSGGGVGCMEHGRPFSYHRVKGIRASGSPAGSHDPPKPSFQDLELHVRHSKDPYIEALLLTHDSLYFGVSEGVKLAGGLELLICGLVLTIPVICHWMEKRRTKVWFGRVSTDDSYGQFDAHAMPVQPARRQRAPPQDKEMEGVVEVHDRL